MDLLLMLLVAQVAVFFLYLPYARLYWPLFAAMLYGVLWYYVDDSEQTGNRSWRWLRNWALWEKQFTAVNYIFSSNKKELEGAERVVFVVVSGNMTNMALISGFGFHGGVFSGIDIYYLLPSVFFRVPGLREILLWSGAIAYDQVQNNLHDRILNVLDKRKSVCFSLNGMMDILKLQHKQENDDEKTGISSELYEFVKEKKISLVPVAIEGEPTRYNIRTNGWQSYFLKMFGYPFPFMFGPRIFGPEPPPKVELIFGTLTDPTKFNNVDHFNKWFLSQVQPALV